MYQRRINVGMTIGLVAAAAMALEADEPRARVREVVERKQRQTRHSPEGNRKQRRAAQAIYRRATRHDF